MLKHVLEEIYYKNEFSAIIIIGKYTYFELEFKNVKFGKLRCTVCQDQQAEFYVQLIIYVGI